MSQDSFFSRLASNSTFSSLAEREYRWYFGGTLAFFMAMQMQFVLRGYLAYDLTDSASSLGLIALSIAAPTLIFAPIGGVIADRVNKKLLLILSQALASVASFVVTVLVLGGWIEFWHLVAVSLCTGVVFSFNMPTRAAITPLLVPQHKLMNAISLQAGGMNLTRIIAPALGGVLIAPLGPGIVYCITGTFFVIATLAEFHLPNHGLTSERRDGSSFVLEFREGLRYVRQERIVGMLLATGLMLPLFGFPVQQMLPVFAEDVFDKGPMGLGLLAAMSGAGGLVGAIVSANMDNQPAKGRLMLIGGMVTGFGLLAFALTPIFVVALLFLAISNIGQMLFQNTNNTVVQARVPAELRGRVNSIMLMSFGAMPLGVLPVTTLADRVGAPATIAGSSVLLVIILIVLFGFVSTLRNLRMDALARAEMSPVQAAVLVAEGKLTQEEADRIMNRRPASTPGASVSRT